MDTTTSAWPGSHPVLLLNQTDRSRRSNPPPLGRSHACRRGACCVGDGPALGDDIGFPNPLTGTDAWIPGTLRGSVVNVSRYA
jgi:hypothetical protein